MEKLQVGISMSTRWTDPPMLLMTALPYAGVCIGESPVPPPGLAWGILLGSAMLHLPRKIYYYSRVREGVGWREGRFPRDAMGSQIVLLP